MGRSHDRTTVNTYRLWGKGRKAATESSVREKGMGINPQLNKKAPDENRTDNPPSSSSNALITELLEAQRRVG